MKLEKRQIEDLLAGTKIMGTGGGREIEWVRPIIKGVYDNGKYPKKKSS